MSKWPQWANRTMDIISGEPTCCACDQPAERFVSVNWSLGHTSDHPVCAKHLRCCHVDFDSLAPELRGVAARSRAEDAA